MKTEATNNLAELYIGPPKKRKRPAVVDADLEPIYQSYPAPRRGGRIEAFKALKKAVIYIAARPALLGSHDSPTSYLLAAVKVYSESEHVKQRIAGGEAQFIPHLSTWLNAGRFECPVETAPISRNTRTSSDLNHNPDLAGAALR